MKTLIGTFDLLNRLTGEFVDALLFEGIDEKNLVDFETSWKPMFEKNIPQEVTRETISSANIEDFGWDWRRLNEFQENLLRNEMFALECEENTQGLMLVDKLAHARHPDQKGAHVVYIDRLATAPWNRLGIAESPLFKGVGQILLHAAISLSIDEEFKGRIGLHSLPGADSFYHHIGMTDLGIDTEKAGLRYFEMTEDQAITYLGDD